MPEPFTATFVAPIIPKGKPRHRSSVRGGQAHTHPDPKGQRWELQFALYASQYAPGTPLEGPVRVDILAVMPRLWVSVGSRSIAGVLRKLHLSHQGSNYRRVKVLISREAEIDV